MKFRGFPSYKISKRHCGDYDWSDHTGSENSGLIKLLICLQKDFE